VKLRPELDVTEHLLLLGRKGVGKTTLAQRIVSRAAADGQLCFFVRASKYRNDFGKMLQLAVAPFSSRSTKELVETAEQCAAPILVVLDGVDRISDDLREDLLLVGLPVFSNDIVARLL
jgi:Cdc6-like AAA superfamily ATPase